MNDTQRDDLRRDSFEERAQKLFLDSVDDVDMRVRSRLTQARTAALANTATRPWSWLTRWAWLSPAAGVTAAAVLGAALWLGHPWGNAGHSILTADSPQGLEDLEMVASTDGSGDSLEMLQDDLDFYDFADKAAAPDTTA